MTTQLRQYRIPSQKYEGWALIVIGQDGYFSTVSDYGNYAFRWSSPGMEFRRFLLDLEPGYLYSKLAGRLHDVFDSEVTVKCIREHILDERRTGNIPKGVARDEWIATEDIEDETSFHDWCNNTLLDSGYEYHRRMPEPQCWGFCTKVFPRFQALLREEISQEARLTIAKPSGMATERYRKFNPKPRRSRFGAGVRF